MFKRWRNVQQATEAARAGTSPALERATATHNAGETTGMFRFRTAAAIHVEMEEEVETSRWSELLRRYFG